MPPTSVERRASDPSARDRRRNLARKLHALRPGIFRPGAEDPPTTRQPVRHEVVTYVLGTTCHLCLRAGQGVCWSERKDLNLRHPGSRPGTQPD